MKSQTGSRALVALLIWSLAVPVFAATLVNINTADLATLETLNGIGPSKGQAIIDYRTQHGAFSKIEDIQNVSGIGPATYANIKDYITVGDSASTQTQSQATQTQTQTSQTQSDQAASQVTQPTTAQSTNGTSAPTITAKITTNAQALAGAGTVFDGAAFNSGGDPLVANVRYMWNFGDGTTAEGKHVLHTYRYPGTYLVELSVAYNFSNAIDRVRLPVVVPNMVLSAEGDGSLTIYNQGASDINIGLWSIVDGAAKPFVIPDDTVVLAGEGVRFDASASGLPGSRDAVLLYPNGTQAASAQVGKSSPLRGERITAGPVAPAPIKATISAPTKTQIAAATDTTPLAAAAAEAPVTGSNTLWLSLGGLVALLIVGGAGAWYMGYIRPTTATETSPTEEEFDIEG